jgi:hypothetical protein
VEPDSSPSPVLSIKAWRNNTMMKKSVEPSYPTLDPHGNLTDAEVLTPLTEVQWKKVRHRVADSLLTAMQDVEGATSVVELATKEVLDILYMHFDRRI